MSQSEESATKQPELDLGIRQTGNAQVDAALTALEGVMDRSVEEHPEVFEDVHRALHSTMMDLDDSSPAHTERPVGDQTSS
jgi:hypothetical protein